jgi:hypothetical protein
VIHSEKKIPAKNNYKFKVYPQASIKRPLFLNKFNKGCAGNIRPGCFEAAPDWIYR